MVANMATGRMKTFYNIGGALIALLSMGLYFADIVTDILVAVKYFKEGDTSWGILTVLMISFPVIAFLGTTITYFLFFSEDGKIARCCYIFGMFGLSPCTMLFAPIGLYCNAGHTLSCSNRENKIKGKRYAAITQTLEALFESTPQIVLQLYIILIDEAPLAEKDIGVERYLCIATSFVAIVWNFFSHEVIVHIINNDNYKMPTRYKLPLFLLTLCECFQRVVATSLFIAFIQDKFVLLITLILHVFFLSIIYFAIEKKLKWNFVIAAILGIVCYTSVKDMETNVKRLFCYHLLVLLENWILIGVWIHFNPTRYEALFLPLLVSFILLSFIQIVTQIIYYKFIEDKIKNNKDDVIITFIMTFKENGN